ncbi:cyclic lactone autoinducer peptide [Bacillus sp. B1-b2]|nr:cyclic lactone autoinducer peptide [Bacillus sp. B1-b2]KAB7670743.1 cyclic lactone autoinducer peptide [Bacillus sp. B1-b2]
MKNPLKLVVGMIAGFIILLAKAEVSSASSIIFYQPKAPKDSE